MRIVRRSSKHLLVQMLANHLIFNSAPASRAVKYHKVSYDGKLDGSSQFRGEPRPELDKAWHDLLENNNIRISKDELQKMNRTAIELYDGSGYFGQLSAYHHLHCLVCVLCTAFKQSTTNRE